MPSEDRELERMSESKLRLRAPVKPLAMALPFLGFNLVMLVLVPCTSWPLWLKLILAAPFALLFVVGILMLAMSCRGK